MRSFRRIKTINGRQYMYEITPYYDKESKIIRHRSRYIDPVKDGKLVEKPSLPKNTYEYGSILPLLKIADDLSINRVFEGNTRWGGCNKGDDFSN